MKWDGEGNKGSANQDVRDRRPRQEEQSNRLVLSDCTSTHGIQ